MARAGGVVPRGRAGGRDPLKVFLTVGTHEQPFRRMVELADRLAVAGHEVAMQYGYSSPPRAVAGFDFAPADEIARLMRQADAVVTHAGPASVLQALDAGRSPIVLPRSPAYGEHVDDHQTAFAVHLARRGLVRVADSPKEAERLLKEKPPAAEEFTRRRKSVDENRLRLARSLDEWLLSRAAARHR